jgi:predicted secreted protein
MLAAGLFAVTVFAQERNLALHDSRILKMVEVLGASHEKAGKCHETGAVTQRPWARYNGDGPRTVIHFGSLL